MAMAIVPAPARAAGRRRASRPGHADLVASLRRRAVELVVGRLDDGIDLAAGSVRRAGPGGSARQRPRALMLQRNAISLPFLRSVATVAPPPLRSSSAWKATDGALSSAMLVILVP